MITIIDHKAAESAVVANPSSSLVSRQSVERSARSLPASSSQRRLVTRDALCYGVSDFETALISAAEIVEGTTVYLGRGSLTYPQMDYMQCTVIQVSFG